MANFAINPGLITTEHLTGGNAVVITVGIQFIKVLYSMLHRGAHVPPSAHPGGTRDGLTEHVNQDN